MIHMWLGLGLAVLREFSHPLHTPCCSRNQPGNRPDCIHNCTDTLHCLETLGVPIIFYNWRGEAGTQPRRSCGTFLSLCCWRLACWWWWFFRGWVGTVALWWGGLQTQVVTLCGLMQRRRSSPWRCSPQATSCDIITPAVSPRGPTREGGKKTRFLLESQSFAFEYDSWRRDD